MGQEVKDYNIRVTTRSPGAVCTELTDHITEPGLAEDVKDVVAEIGVSASTMASMVAFAMSQPDDVDVNEPVPAVEAPTTYGVTTSEDYRGKWLVLFSHNGRLHAGLHHRAHRLRQAPQGFPVEHLRAARAVHRQPLLAHHVGAQHQGEARCRHRLPDHRGLSMQLAKAYGMIQPGASDTSAVRATFIIDPEGILRAMVHYPMSNGRSIDEPVRLVKAMQTSDANKVATPEPWQPGDKLIVPPPATAEAAAARMDEGYECTDWYFCKKQIGPFWSEEPRPRGSPASLFSG